jgi:hypothetical protein
MNTYNIYRINEHGEPIKKQTIHAYTIDSAWDGNKGWYTDGLFLITNGDGSEATTEIIRRSDEPTKIPEPDEPAPLRVCEHCLMAIESREGQQITRKIYVDEDNPQKCDWCETDDNDILYEIL